jgi:hypothetical protein
VPENVDAEGGQALGKVAGVGVDGVAQKQLRADMFFLRFGDIFI